jgi:hypothetical protein
MAHKFDFSKLDTKIDLPENPYQYTDKLHFAREFKGESPRLGTVTVGLDQRRLTPGLDDLVVPAEAHGRRFELVLMGQRGTDWDETVRATLAERRTAFIETFDEPTDLTEGDWDRADGITTPVEVEGFWKKRFWKDRAGNWQSVMQLHVARFVFEGQEKGRLPEMG